MLTLRVCCSRLLAELRAASLIGAVLLSLSCRSDEGVARAASEAEAKRSRLTAFNDRMSKLRGGVESVPREERPCSESAIERRLRGRESKLLLVDQAYLGRFADPGLDPYGGEAARWKFLTGPALRAIPLFQQPPADPALTDAVFKTVKLDETYVYAAVLRGDRREPPRLEGERFHAGILEGWLVLAELKGGPALCATRVSARSSEEVAGRGGQTPNDVLWRDFVRQVRNELDQAAQRLSSRFQVDLE